MLSMDMLLMSIAYIALAEILVLPLSIAIAKILNTSDDATSLATQTVSDPELKKDRLRYTKNTTSATLAYVAILFNVFYFVSIYSSDVGNYYYTKTIGFSVICNLLFLLATFLCSEGVKNYKFGYALAFIVLGLFQLIRIISIPLDAHSKVISLNGSQVKVMDDQQFIWVCLCLVCSALACFAAAAIGLNKTKILRDYEKKIANN